MSERPRSEPPPSLRPSLPPPLRGAARGALGVRPSSLGQARAPLTAPPFIARWDLDKTYLRTDFDTVRDLVRTAVERPDQKRTVPGAATLMRELGRAGAEIHILSGSPEQLRSRLEQKLRLDGARWASLTAQAQPGEHPPPALPRAARPARLQAPLAPAPPLRARRPAPRYR